ncbi:hypothetical protein [Legionella septentrionalis]|uniref:Uncharacterized protein n=1 Tax=Legionella septentrionalis TaxID=2498109 RepID=A0A3S0X011_9GAMM|nr:hypothetical protein [Legionella septentrionalis]RUQ85248.1 hypothetical protein EKM59_06855 [Legionella septentrionalis]
MNLFDSNWLVTDASRAKASLKFEIRCLEVRFHSLFLNAGKKIGNEELILLCNTLSDCYQRYAQLIVTSKEFRQYAIPIPACNELDCYGHITALKTQWSTMQELAAEKKIVWELHKQYQCLFLLLKTDERATTQKEAADMTVLIKPLLHAKSPDEWLSVMVYLAQHQHQQFFPDFNSLCKLTNRQLLHIANAFSQQEYVDVINAIFFFKIQPQKLFVSNVHLEKLVSIKTRLSFLYEFIEKLHFGIQEEFNKRKLGIMQDYLFHSEELPQGIAIEINDACRDLIIATVKSWHMNMKIAAEHRNPEQLNEIIRAYKFWFNPNRLIDAVMLLKQNSTSLHETSFAEFHQHMLSLYHELTTTDCLDLYGYFANKDSCYLMRTLLSLTQNTEISWLPALNVAERNALHSVYSALDCAMNALRDELAARHISTAPYKRDLHGKKINPGQRNRNAVIRIITLYSKDTAEPNAKIELLFSELEKLYLTSSSNCSAV